jgi:hypothetical protein
MAGLLTDIVWTDPALAEPARGTFDDAMELDRQLALMPARGSRAERATVALQRLQARFRRG